MSRKDCSPINASAPDTNDLKPDTKGEYFSTNLMLEGVSAHQDTTTLLMDSGKTPQPAKPNSRHALLAHICWAVFASLLTMFAVNDFKLASSVEQNQSTAALPKSLSQNADGSLSSLPRSHLTTPAASYFAACTVSPNWSLISTAMSACLVSCLLDNKIRRECHSDLCKQTSGRLFRRFQPLLTPLSRPGWFPQRLLYNSDSYWRIAYQFSQNSDTTWHYDKHLWRCKRLRWIELKQCDCYSLRI